VCPILAAAPRRALPLKAFEGILKFAFTRSVIGILENFGRVLIQHPTVHQGGDGLKKWCW